MPPPALFAWLAGSYLCGSVSFALILGRLRGVDVRQVGSGNVGATNVGRVLGPKWGYTCFVLDVLKGFAPVFVAGVAMGFAAMLSEGELAAGDAWAWLAIGAAAVVGHVFPVWLKFRGGKGVATSFGVMLGYWPALTAAAGAGLLVWAAIVAATRYVSLASVAAAVCLPLFVWLWGLLRKQTGEQIVPFILTTGGLALLVVWRHRTNIRRLIAGTEPKLGSKVEGVDEARDAGNSGGTP